MARNPAPIEPAVRNTACKLSTRGGILKDLAAALALSLLSASYPAAQQAGEPEQSPVFRSGASLVAINVTVLDNSKKYVTGLEAGDFSVFEDGVQQEVRFFEASAVPIDLIVLIDTSSSMRHRMDLVHDAALGFIKTLRRGDRGAVVAFNDGVDVVQPLTGDQAALEAAIRSTVAGGATALHNAVYIALKQFGRRATDSTEVRRQALAVLSDGDDTSSLIAFEDVLEVARQSGVSVYPIALSPEFEMNRSASGAPIFSQSQYAMRTLAQDTGAQAFFPHSANELGAVYAAIAQELSNQYSIGYAPRNLRPDGRFRRIVIRVNSRPELRPLDMWLQAAPPSIIKLPTADLDNDRQRREQ
jgi:Ca-activated chloride channel homolog